MYGISELDVVYTVKHSDDNEELKYSLRSLKNIPHKRVVFVGHKPIWSKPDLHIPVEQTGVSKVAKTNHNWFTVALNKEVSSQFILMNDDFFIMKPIKKLPFYHSSSHNKFEKYYQENHPNSSYTDVIINTSKRLIELGIENPKSYELHLPTIISKQAIRIALARQHYRITPINIRTLAIHLMEVDSVKRNDVKFYGSRESDKSPDMELPEMDFISTDDNTWNSEIGDYVKSMFQKKSRYEK